MRGVSWQIERTPGRAEGDFRARLWTRLKDPANLIVPPVIAIFCLIRSFGLIAEIPYWVIVALVVTAFVVNSVNVAFWVDATEGWRLTARVGVEMAVIAMVIYGIGWGAFLAVGFVFGAADIMRSAGSAAARPSIIWTLICIGLGEAAIAAGFAPTLIHQPLVHALAALDALGAVVTIMLLEWFAIARESSEGRFEALVQEASDIIIVADDSDRLRYVSPAFDRLLGYSADAMRTRPATDIMHPDDLAALRTRSDEITRPGSDGVHTDFRLRHRNGSWRWFEATITNHLDNPKVRGIVSNLHDITERKQADEALREAHERFLSAFENAPIGIAMIDLDGDVLRANSAYGRIVGYPGARLCGMNVHDLTHPQDRESSKAEMARFVSKTADVSDTYRLEKRYLNAEGREVWVSVNVSCVRDDEGKPLYMIEQIEDVTERRELRERLAHAAIHDPLTTLPNRLLFMDRLEVALSRAGRIHGRAAVIFLDLDGFKLVNDSMGHAAGDELLKAVAERLRAAMRPSDTVARFGGDEFVVLCEEITEEQEAFEIAERIAEALSRPIELFDGEIFVTASQGLAISEAEGDTASGLLRDADTAMYVAKERGRSRIQMFDSQSHGVALKQMNTLSQLHRALERSEFRVFYQPIVDLQTGRLAGLEALLRWQHPDRGLMHPAEFLAMTEESGLIVPIGAWVLEEATRQYVVWERERRERGAPSLSVGMSVNLSPRQLTQPNLIEQIAGTLDSSGIDPSALWLEITEGALATDTETTLQVLHHLRALGVHLSIDDFGSGYASLGYLRSFPVEALKIDRSFVDGLGRGTADATIVGLIGDLTRSLGLICIAEGVERSNQLDDLRALGCDFAQGFLLGVPLPAETLGEVLNDDLSPWAVNNSPLFGAVASAS
jgi:diguanylate cyclase (GGDEF)-like protein/PAS domain S-box-containing protein